MTLRYRKIGGIHWLWLGPWVLTLCHRRHNIAPVQHKDAA